MSDWGIKAVSLRSSIWFPVALLRGKFVRSCVLCRVPMPRKKSKQSPRALMASDLLRLSPAEARKRVGLKRRRSSLKPPASEPSAKYDPSVLKRWRKPEKPIEIIG